MNSRRLTVLAVLFCSLWVTGQEETTPKPDYYYDVLGTAQLGYLIPSTFGESYLDGYDFWNGFHFDAKAYVNEQIALGVQVEAFKGRVIDPTLVGAIDASRVIHGYAVGSYIPFDRKKDLLFEVGMGLGFIDIRNEKGVQRFHDTGFSVMVNAQVSYRLNKWFGLYARAQANWGFLDIEAAPEIDDLFNSSQFFSPSLGIRVFIL
ncbi:MAG: hypothetical protein HRT65_02715 [Flavobacteriaceae bacterium]|nr:hypothetical protein [Flavobacteriaceae bacterium]